MAESPLHVRLRRKAARSRIAQRSRQRRYNAFRRLLAVGDVETILDVGVGQGATLARFDPPNRIVGLDLHDRNRALLESSGVELVVGDARSMAFEDRSFDIVFCNSLVEHVPPSDRSSVASEIRRVAHRYWVQTPSRSFPIEPHYMLPLVQFLPRSVRHGLDRRFCGGEIDLLTERELRSLFPDASIYRERLFGLTKSLVAYRS